MQKKNVVARVHNSTGTYVTTWAAFEFNGFTKILNGGLGECVIKLAVPFDYDGPDVQFMNNVELLISDSDTIETSETSPYGTRTVYRGYISLIERDIGPGVDSITVHLLGYFTLLAMTVLRSGNYTSIISNNSAPPYLVDTTGTNGPADIGGMFREVIDSHNAAVTGANPFAPLYWDDDSIPLTGTTAAIQFVLNSHREALDTLKNMAPSNVYWYVDENGRVSFKAIDTNPTHTFVFNRHSVAVHVENSIENIRNNIILAHSLSTGVAMKEYSDEFSAADYITRTHRGTDVLYGDEAAADANAARFLSTSKNPSVKIIVTIADNNGSGAFEGYDIESINPGDTCRFQNFSSGLSEIFQDNMVITSVRYLLDSVQLEIELFKNGLLDVQARQQREINRVSGTLLPNVLT